MNPLLGWVLIALAGPALGGGLGYLLATQPTFDNPVPNVGTATRRYLAGISALAGLMLLVWGAAIQEVTH